MKFKKKLKDYIREEIKFLQSIPNFVRVPHRLLIKEASQVTTKIHQEFNCIVAFN